MTAILPFERTRIKEIEAESGKIRSIRRSINTAHRYITELATLGESVLAWDSTDYRIYHERREAVDSQLQDMKRHCSGYIQPEQIDSLCCLLLDKEKHLWRIMETFHNQEMANGFIVTHLPEIIRQVVRTKTVIQKRKEVAGWFGKKDTLKISVPAESLRSFNKQIIAMQEEYRRLINIYTDSRKSP